MIRFKTIMLLSFLFVALLLPFLSEGQRTNDSIVTRNVIKYNVTAPLIWGANNYVFEYERVLSSKRSMSITLGYRTFPKLIGLGKTDSAFIVRGHKNNGGISAGIDYRFYLKSENRYAAPRGIYFAPYVSYFSNSFTNIFLLFIAMLLKLV